VNKNICRDTKIRIDVLEINSQKVNKKKRKEKDKLN
jgi:hypothetical protein